MQNHQNSAIQKLIENGEFKKAEAQIHKTLQNVKISANERYQLLFQQDLMERILLDFSLNEKDIKRSLEKYYPQLSEDQQRSWEQKKELEMRIIDGEKRYFKNSVNNLFRLNKEANAVKKSVDGVDMIDDSAAILASYLPQVVKYLTENKTHLADKKHFLLKYTITLQPDVVPEGEIVRCWLPFPREGHDRQMNIKLESINTPNYQIAPPEQLHRSVYCEKKTIKGQPTVFELSFSMDVMAEHHSMQGLVANPYNKQSKLYKEFTAERAPHILFSDRIKRQTLEIIGNETNPIKKVELIYRWIDHQFPWCSALEYSTFNNIPEYILENGHGDCGMKTLLFMTMARCAGIPCKWQSGWMLHPGDVNLHDWCKVYYEGTGWIPLDQSFGIQKSANKEVQDFYITGIDGYRLIVNDDFSAPLYPPKTFSRSETIDFQRGELEWKGGNIYFNKWNYHLEVKE